MCFEQHFIIILAELINTSSHLSDQIKMVILAQEKNKILCRRIT